VMSVITNVKRPDEISFLSDSKDLLVKQNPLATNTWVSNASVSMMVFVAIEIQDGYRSQLVDSTFIHEYIVERFLLDITLRTRVG